MRLLPRVAAVGLLVTSSLVTAVPAAAQTPTSTPTATATSTPLVVKVGSGEPGYAVNLYGPGAITVQTGSTLSFKGNWLEPHTVTFLGGSPRPTPADPKAPVPTDPGKVVGYDGTKYLSSGFITSRDPAFSVSFPKAGTYPFLCIIHPGMDGTVTVVDSGATSTQAQLDNTAQQVFAAALAALKAQAATLAAKPVTQTRNADGTTTFRVTTVGGYVAPSDIQQFFPPSMNVNVGDTVVFENTVPTPHTVTFLGGTPLPFPPSLEDPKIGAPTPAPAAGYDGTGYVNSGVIGQGFGGSSFSIKFSKAGAFPFVCILHVDQGMGGTINVASATAAITPPRTGAAGLVGDTSSPAMAALLALGAIVLVTGSRFATVRSR